MSSRRLDCPILRRWSPARRYDIRSKPASLQDCLQWAPHRHRFFVLRWARGCHPMELRLGPNGSWSSHNLQGHRESGSDTGAELKADNLIAQQSHLNSVLLKGASQALMPSSCPLGEDKWSLNYETKVLEEGGCWIGFVSTVYLGFCKVMMGIPYSRDMYPDDPTLTSALTSGADEYSRHAVAHGICHCRFWLTVNCFLKRQSLRGKPRISWWALKLSDQWWMIANCTGSLNSAGNMAKTTVLRCLESLLETV